MSKNLSITRDDAEWDSIVTRNNINLPTSCTSVTYDRNDSWWGHNITRTGVHIGNNFLSITLNQEEFVSRNNKDHEYDLLAKIGKSYSDSFHHYE